MKALPFRPLDYFLVAIALVGIVKMATNTYWDIPAQPAPPIDEWTRICPIELDNVLKKSAERVHRNEEWEIYTYGASGPPPDVAVLPIREEMDGARKLVCQLTLSRVPDTPERGADWRVGYILTDASGLFGRNVEFRLKIRGDRAFELDRASAYIYDGVGVAGIAIPHITTDWQEVRVTKQIATGAQRLEFWFRILFDDGTVRPPVGTIDFDASADLVR